ncbi:hypothetical protein HMPREF1039_1618, partial [Megasphaera lornae]
MAIQSIFIKPQCQTFIIHCCFNVCISCYRYHTSCCDGLFTDYLIGILESKSPLQCFDVTFIFTYTSSQSCNIGCICFRLCLDRIQCSLNCATRYKICVIRFHFSRTEFICPCRSFFITYIACVFICFLVKVTCYGFFDVCITDVDFIRLATVFTVFCCNCCVSSVSNFYRTFSKVFNDCLAGFGNVIKRSIGFICQFALVSFIFNCSIYFSTRYKVCVVFFNFSCTEFSCPCSSIRYIACVFLGKCIIQRS